MLHTERDFLLLIEEKDEKIGYEYDAAVIPKR